MDYNKEIKKHMDYNKEIKKHMDYNVVYHNYKV